MKRKAKKTAKPAAKRSRGRPAFEVTAKLRLQVEMMVAFGNTELQISTILGITPPTLRLHFRAEIDRGFLKANNAVAMNLFRQATKDDPRAFNAIKFWMQTRAGWTEYMIPQQPTKEEPKGKKAEAEEAAKHPDTSTSIGELMAKRASTTLQ